MNSRARQRALALKKRDWSSHGWTPAGRPGKRQRREDGSACQRAPAACQHQNQRQAAGGQVGGIFRNLSFYLDGRVGAAGTLAMARLIREHGGCTISAPRASTSFVVATNLAATKIQRALAARQHRASRGATCVRPEWILACCEGGALVATEPYIVAADPEARTLQQVLMSEAASVENGPLVSVTGTSGSPGRAPVREPLAELAQPPTQGRAATEASTKRSTPRHRQRNSSWRRRKMGELEACVEKARVWQQKQLLKRHADRESFADHLQKRVDAMVRAARAAIASRAATLGSTQT
eukprot:COSAG01_NODE_478_length_16479_cov_45.015629_2_plen_296_part_00